MGPDQICYDNAAPLFDFVTEIFKLKFTDCPNYAKLKHLLVRALLRRDEVPDNNFSWFNFAAIQQQESIKDDLDLICENDEFEAGDNAIKD